MKRVATIQDISCIGRCSLTVALPVISALGIETAVIPTAVLSNHTAFSDFTFRDLTADIPGIISRWEAEALTFDAVYSGYLGSAEQVDMVRRMYRAFQPRLKIVDPAMADFGRLYAGFDEAFVETMAGLCAEADVVIPNLTEACLMSGMPYRPDGGEAFVKELLKRLAERGAKKVILTGVGAPPDRMGAMCYDREKDTFFVYYNEKLPVQFHGTGDIFASCITGALVNGYSIDDALRCAVDFTLECIRKTAEDPDAVWYGVNFEQALPFLLTFRPHPSPSPSAEKK